MVKNNRGRFITLEGIEGVGKTTNLAFVEKVVREDFDKSVLITREPGGTWYAEAIRQLLLQEAPEKLCPDAELLLMNAARAQHWQSTIRSALEDGTWVICSRFADSTLAYQGGGRGIGLERAQRLADWHLQGAAPDLTLLLDLPVDKALARIQERKALDRIEQEKRDFFERVRQAYLAIAKAQPKRIVVISAELPLAEVQQQIKRALKSRTLG